MVQKAYNTRYDSENALKCRESNRTMRTKTARSFMSLLRVSLVGACVLSPSESSAAFLSARDFPNLDDAISLAFQRYEAPQGSSSETMLARRIPLGFANLGNALASGTANDLEAFLKLDRALPVLEHLVTNAGGVGSLLVGSRLQRSGVSLNEAADKFDTLLEALVGTATNADSTPKTLEEAVNEIQQVLQGSDPDSLSVREKLEELRNKVALGAQHGHEDSLQGAVEAVSELVGGDSAPSLFYRLDNEVMDLLGAPTYDELANTPTVKERVLPCAQAFSDPEEAKNFAKCLRELKGTVVGDATKIYVRAICAAMGLMKDELGTIKGEKNRSLRKIQLAKPCVDAEAATLGDALRNLESRLDGVAGESAVDKLETLRAAVANMMTTPGSARKPAGVDKSSSLGALVQRMPDFVS